MCHMLLQLAVCYAIFVKYKGTLLMKNGCKIAVHLTIALEQTRLMMTTPTVAATVEMKSQLLEMHWWNIYLHKFY